jgi:hypothetical protein
MRIAWRIPLCGLAATALLLAAAPAAAAPGTIFFTTAAPGEPGVAQLWSIREDGTNLKRLRRQMPVGPEGGIATLSQDGRHILCVCRLDEVDSMRLDGTHLRPIGRKPRNTRYDVATLSSNGSVFWVRGSKKILSQNARTGKRRGFAGAKARSAVIDERVVPSPGGSHVAYVAYGCLLPGCPSEEVETLMTARADGSDRTLVYQSEGVGKEIFDVAWSPDGGRLILSDGTGEDPKGELPVHYPRQLFLVPADGSEPQGKGLPFSEDFFYPFFSPAGHRLALTGFTNQRLRLQTSALDGTSPFALPGTACKGYCEHAPRVIAWVR